MESGLGGFWCTPWMYGLRGKDFRGKLQGATADVSFEAEKPSSLDAGSSLQPYGPVACSVLRPDPCDKFVPAWAAGDRV